MVNIGVVDTQSVLALAPFLGALSLRALSLGVAIRLGVYMKAQSGQSEAHWAFSPR